MESLVNICRNTILTHGLIPAGERVLVGVSGGADSVALLLVLSDLRETLGFELCAAHLNHGIRGAEADEDQAYVRELCRSMALPLYEERLDIPSIARAQGKTLEQAAREQRYAFFDRAMAELGAGRIAVAHHMEDQAESIMLHLIRGSGLKGLTGMKYQRDSIIRPLLDTHRSQVEGYLGERGIAYRTDSTNLDRDASRNRLRLDVLPYIAEHINPAITDSLCSMAGLLDEDEAYLAREAARALDAAATPGGYDRAALMELPRPIQSRAVRMAIERAGVHSDIDRVHVEKVMELLKARTGASLDLPHIAAWVSYGNICFGSRPDEKAQYEHPFVFPGETSAGDGFFFSDIPEGGIIKDNLVGFMDVDRLPPDAVVRTRRPGDTFFPCGAPGAKKLKAVFIDRKIPREQREQPGIFSGNEALFIPGLGVSDRVKVTADTGNIIRVRYIKIIGGIHHAGL